MQSIWLLLLWEWEPAAEQQKVQTEDNSVIPTSDKALVEVVDMNNVKKKSFHCLFTFHNYYNEVK